MIFGDRQELAIEVARFDAPWRSLDAQEDSVWGALSVWVCGENLSEHRRHGTDRIRDDTHVPLIPLARWALGARAALRYEERSPLGACSSPREELDRWSDGGPPPTGFTEAQWLDRRDAWWSEHFTGAATLDVIAPSIGIVRNDDRALVSWRVPTLPRPDRTFVRPEGSRVVSWLVVERALEEFVSSVATWAPDIRLQADGDAETPALEYYTGLTDREIERFDFMAEAARDPATDPLAQVLRDLTRRTSMGPGHQGIVQGVRMASRPGSRGWWELRQQLVPSPGRSFESDGYAGAEAARKLLGLDGQPIADMEALLRSVDVHVSDDAPQAEGDRMIVAGTASGRAVTMVLANARTAKPWAKRFELARALGHLLLDQVRGEAIGAASGPQAVASRRRRAGAFAAEVLLPTAALEEASDGIRDGVQEGQRFATLLDRFGVGANTAAYHLWNRGFLSSPEVRDDLIASV